MTSCSLRRLSKRLSVFSHRSHLSSTKVMSVHGFLSRVSSATGSFVSWQRTKHLTSLHGSFQARMTCFARSTFGMKMRDPMANGPYPCMLQGPVNGTSCLMPKPSVPSSYHSLSCVRVLQVPLASLRLSLRLCPSQSVMTVHQSQLEHMTLLTMISM